MRERLRLAMFLQVLLPVVLLVVFSTIVRAYDEGSHHTCIRVEMEAVRSFVEYSQLMQKHHKRVVVGLAAFTEDDEDDFKRAIGKFLPMLSGVSKRTRGVYGCGSVVLFAFGPGSGFQGLMTKSQLKVFLWGARTKMEAVSEPLQRINQGEDWMGET